MSRKSQVILTNMCLIEDNQNRIVMQIRDPKMYSWSGAALPGGHIEEKERASTKQLCVKFMKKRD